MLPTIKVVILFVTLTVHGMVMEYTRNSLVLQKVVTHELNICGVQFTRSTSVQQALRNLAGTTVTSFHLVCALTRRAPEPWHQWTFPCRRSAERQSTSSHRNQNQSDPSVNFSHTTAPLPLCLSRILLKWKLMWRGTLWQGSWFWLFWEHC